jgi:glycine dehydrogenase subunit 1
MAVTAAIQLGWLGTQGLREIATRCAQGAHYLFDELVKIDEVTAVSSQPFFREFAVHLGRDASDVLLTMAHDGVLGGVSVAALTSGSDPSIEGELDDVLLVTVTERRTKDEIDRYVEILRKAVGQ